MSNSTATIDLDMALTPQVLPTGGRLCLRNLSEGKALVGLLHLPKDFKVEEGRSYVLVQHLSSVCIAKEPLADTLSEQYQAYDVDGLLRAPVWRGVKAPHIIVVKFMEAFPGDNAWVVYGASNHRPAANAQSHTWWDIDKTGALTAIEPPVDAVGSTMGQLLSMHPIWPNAQGVPHTLSKLPVAMRHTYHRYHQVLVASTKDEALDATLEQTVRKDPEFSQIGIGRIDRQFCRYLANMDALGGLKVDGPRSADDFAIEEDLVTQAMHQTLRAPEVSKPPRMR